MATNNNDPLGILVEEPKKSDGSDPLGILTVEKKSSDGSVDTKPSDTESSLQSPSDESRDEVQKDLGGAFTSGKYINKDPQQLLDATTPQSDAPAAQPEQANIPQMPEGGVAAPSQDVPVKFITPTRLLDIMRTGDKAPLPEEEKSGLQQIAESVKKIGEAVNGDPKVLKEMSDEWWGKPLAAQIGAVYGIGNGFKKLSEAGQELGLGGVQLNSSGRNPLESGIHLLSGATEMAFGTAMTVTPAGQIINVSTSELPEEAKKVMFSPVTKAYEMIKGGKSPSQIFEDTSDESPKSESGKEFLGLLDATAAILAGGKVDKSVRDAAKKILNRTAKKGDYKTILDNQNNVTGGDVKKASDLVEQLSDVPQKKQNEIIALSSDHAEAAQKAQDAPEALKKAYEDKSKDIAQKISDVVNPELKKPETPAGKSEKPIKPKEDATQEVNKQESVQPKRESGDVSGKAAEAGGSDSVQRAEESKKEVAAPNESIPVIEHDLKNGDKIKVAIGHEEVAGTVTGVGKHKGKIVIDFKDQNGNERFAYSHQIKDISHEVKELPKKDQLASGEPERQSESQVEPQAAVVKEKVVKKKKAAPGKAIEPNPKVKTDLETVAKELKLSDAEKTIYQELHDVPDDQKASVMEAVIKNKEAEHDKIDEAIGKIDDKKTDIDNEIDDVESDTTLSPSKIKKATAVLQNKYKALEKEAAELEKQKADKRDAISDLEIEHYPIQDGEYEGVNRIIDRVNARLQTRKGVKAGTDLFPDQASIKEAKRKKKIKDVLDALEGAKADTKNKAFDAVLGIALKTWNAAIDVVKAAVKGGAKLGEAINKGLDYLRKAHGSFDESAAKEKIKDVVKKKPNPQALGFMHEKHIVNAVNKYLNKDYADYESIPRKEVADMIRKRKEASPEEKLREQISAIDVKKSTFKDKINAAIDLVKKIEIKDPIKKKATELMARGAAILDSYVHEPKWTDLHQAIGEYSFEKQKNDRQVKELMDAAKKQVSSPIKREAISNWIEAGGDLDVLRDRAAKSKDKFKKGYQAALELSPSEIKVAQLLNQYFDDMFRQGFDNGIIKNMLEDYITHIGVKEDNPALGKLQYDLASGKINTSFQYARQRTFDTFFDLEQAGYRAASKDFADILGVYSQTFNKAIYSRAFVKNMTKGKASDGRPLVAQSGSGSLTEATETTPTQAMMVNPFTKGHEEFDYKSINHPAFRNWYWSTKGPDGTNVFAKGDLVVHPEIYKHLDNILGKSIFRNTSFGRGYMQLSAFTKKIVFSLSPFFHYVQEGTHAIGHTINPAKVDKIDFNDPVQKKAIQHGLMLYDYNAAHNFTEGLTSGSLGKKIPIYNSTVIPMQDFLFQDYIPRLKMTTFKHALERNMDRSKKDLKKGTITEDQIYAKTARQMNAAYGHLNYDLIGRNKTTQDLFRAVSLAPDFLEARVRFVGQALTPRGAEQRRALLVLGVGMYMAARVLNKLSDDDYHFDEPFAVIHNKKKYALRSVPADIYEMINDFGKFTYHRIAPYTGVLIEGVTKYDVARQQKIEYSDFLKDATTAWMPNQIKEQLPDDWQKFPQEEKLFTNFVNTLGVKESKYTPADKIKAFKLLDKLKSMDIGDDHKKAIRKFKSLIEAGDTTAANKMWEENINDIVDEAKHLPPDFSYKIKNLIPRFWVDQDEQPPLQAPVQSPKAIPDDEERKPIPR